ncbi:RIP metalloprotease RseP [Patescibacteria group bacterium]|nr:RIP metalloprotease RseP [Patescibacteria group bacterium]
MFTTIILFVAILSILVFVHEFGHFWTAKKLGVKAEEFGLGFPPRAWGIYKSTNNKWKQVWGTKDVKDAEDTIYSINFIPLGGFVKIKGENGESLDTDSFASKPIWCRFLILSAGVTMNVLLTAFLLAVGFTIGLPQVIDNEVSKSATISDERIQITQVLSDTPASKAGIKMGDIITNINSVEFSNIIDMQDYVAENTGEALSYSIKRGDEVLIYEITPEVLEETKIGGIGVAVAATGMVKFPWYIAIWKGLVSAILLVIAIIVAFYNLFKDIFTGVGVGGDIAGPVGIASLTGDMAKLGFVYILQFTALLSANLAVVNFLPFPALDGGRVLFLIIEKFKGSPVKRDLEATIHYIGFALLMVLVVFVTFKDIAKF